MIYQQKYIKIRTICLGTLAKKIALKMHTSRYNDVQTYCIVREEEISSMLCPDVLNADIILCVADLYDGFVKKYLLDLLDILSVDNKRIVTMVINGNLSSMTNERLLNDIKTRSSLLDVEAQESKVSTLLYAFYDLIDVAIDEYRASDWGDISSLINLKRFFDGAYDLQLYVNYSFEQIRSDIEAKKKLVILLDSASKVWIGSKCTNAHTIEKLCTLSDKVQEGMNEDADFFCTQSEGSVDSVDEGHVNILLTVRRTGKKKKYL